MAIAYGGDGVDVFTALYDPAGQSTLYGDAGGDYFYGGYLDVGNGVEPSRETSFGGDGNDIFDLVTGDDLAFGENGQDYLYMGTGNDTMFGGTGVDVLLGEAGNDYFDGGEGVNYYFGDGGNNIFVSNGVASVQVVQDWNPPTDTVQVNGSGFTSFADVLSHSYQNGAFFVVQVDSDTAVWLNGATASTLTAANFSIVN